MIETINCPCGKSNQAMYKELRIRDPKSDPTFPHDIIIDRFYQCTQCGIRFNKT